jgi:hypothetical protein
LRGVTARSANISRSAPARRRTIPPWTAEAQGNGLPPLWKRGDPPVEQFTTVELVTDACPAKTAVLTVAPALLLRSDHVID